MNTYLLNPKHFNSVEAGIKRLCNQVNFDFGKEIEELFPLHTTGYPQALKTLMDTARELSVISYTMQYKGFYTDKELNKEIEKQIAVLTENKTDFEYLANTPLYMALSTLNAQINPSKVEVLRALTPTEENVVKCLGHLRNALARHIVQETEEFLSSSWEIL